MVPCGVTLSGTTFPFHSSTDEVTGTIITLISNNTQGFPRKPAVDVADRAEVSLLQQNVKGYGHVCGLPIL